jgi:hypothetical protein
MANALPLLLLAGTGVVLLGKKKKSTSKKKTGIPSDYFDGYFAEGATVGAATGLSDIEKPVTLHNLAIRDDNGDMHPVSKATFQPNGQWITDAVFQWPVSGKGLDRVVTNFYGPGARAFANEVMDEFIEGEDAVTQDPALARSIALKVLSRLRSKVNWQNAQPGTIEGMVLDGATVITRIVQQNLPGA